MVALTFYLFSAITLLSAGMVIAARNPVHSVFFLILSFCGAAGLFVLMGAEFLGMALIIVYVGAVAVLFLFVVMLLDIPTPQRSPVLLSALYECVKTVVQLVLYGVLFCGSFVVTFAGLFYGLHRASLFFTVIEFFNQGSLSIILQQLKDFLWGLPMIEKGVLIGHLILAIVLARAIAMMIARAPIMALLARLNRHFSLSLLAIALLGAEIFPVLMSVTPHSLAKDMAAAPLTALSASNTQSLGKFLYTDYFYAFQSAGFLLLVAMIGAIVLTHRQRTDIKRQNIRKQVNRQRTEAVELHSPKIGQGTL